MVDTIGNFIGGKYREISKKFMTVLKDSKFYEQGILTPQEFTKAGDYLTTKCPTWKWCANKKGCTSVESEYLLDTKQYLLTTVPCRDRVKLYANSSKITENVVENDWVETNTEFASQKQQKKDIKDVCEVDMSENKKVVVIEIKDDYIEGIEIDDSDKKDTTTTNQDHGFIVIEQEDDTIVKTRMYDVMITYDFYYRVPRMWLVGYSESGNPLTDYEVKEDIMLDYIDKTVTIEKLANTGIKSVSIHPCKTAMLLLKMMENFEKAGKKLDVEKSVVLLLKFLQSVVPTINYDFTLDIDF